MMKKLLFTLMFCSIVPMLASADNDLCPDSNHPHKIDLGLPSGTRWACCNVDPDPTKQTPTNYGGYYAWGELVEKDWYGWSNYSLSSAGSMYDLTAEEDVSTVLWGSKWRMPTMDEFRELIKYCTWSWEEYNGVMGARVTGPNGNAIFLPAGAMKDENYYTAKVGTYGSYWGRTHASSSSYATELVFGTAYYNNNYQIGDFYYEMGPTGTRQTGRLVRAVGTERYIDDNDYTIYITNPSFDDNLYSGWEGTVLSGVGPDNNAEHYNKNYDTFQHLHGLPPGWYTLGLQGFYRKGSYSNDYALWLANDTEHNHALLYASSAAGSYSVPLVPASSAAIPERLGGNTARVGNGLYIPDNMVAAGAWFEAGYYHNYLDVEVGDDGELTIGIKKDVTLSGDWTMIDNWTLFRTDNNPVKMITPDAATFKVSDIRDMSFVASWEYVPGARFYDIVVKELDGTYDNPVFKRSLTATSIEVTGLNPDTYYQFKVRARNGNKNQNSDWSSIPNAVKTTNVGTSPAALVIHSNNGFDGTEPLTLGLSYYYNVWIANQEDHTWQGSFYLKDGDEDIKAWDNITIPKNAIVPLEFDYTPESVGSKGFVLYYQTNGKGSGIPVATRDGGDNIMLIQVNPNLTYNEGIQLTTAIDCPESILRGEKCKITAHIKNNGSNEWTGTLYIADNGVSLVEKEVTMASGKEETLVVNEWAPETSGRHQIGAYYMAYKGFYREPVYGNGFTNPIWVDVLAANANFPSLATITHVSKDVEPTEVTEGSEVYYYFRITDEQGNRLKGVRIIFKVEGSTKRDIINTTLSDDNGLAVLDLQTEGSAAIAERGQTVKLSYQHLVDENNDGVQFIVPDEIIQLKIHQGNDVSEFTGYENVESIEFKALYGISAKTDKYKIANFSANAGITFPISFKLKHNDLANLNPTISINSGLEAKAGVNLKFWKSFINVEGGVKGSVNETNTYNFNNPVKTYLAVLMGTTENIHIFTNGTTLKAINAIQSWFGKKHGERFFDEILEPNDTYNDIRLGVNFKGEFNFLKLIPQNVGKVKGKKLPNLIWSRKAHLSAKGNAAFTWEPWKTRFKDDRYLYGKSGETKLEVGGDFGVILGDIASPQKPWWRFASGMTKWYNNLNKFLKETDSHGSLNFAYTWKEEEMYTSDAREHLAEISNTYEIQTASTWGLDNLKKYFCSEWMEENPKSKDTSKGELTLSNTLKFKMVSKGDWLTQMEEFANKNDEYNQIAGNIYPHFSSKYLIASPRKHKEIWEDSNLLGYLNAIPANGDYDIKKSLKISMQNSSEFGGRVSIPVHKFKFGMVYLDLGLNAKVEFYPTESYYSVSDRCFLPVVLRPSSSLESISKAFTGRIRDKLKNVFSDEDVKEIEEEYDQVGQKFEIYPRPNIATKLENKVSPHTYNTNALRIKYKHPMIAQNLQKDICNLKFTINDGTTNFEEGTIVAFEHYYPAGCLFGFTDEGDTLFVVSEVCELSALHGNDTLKTTHQGKIKLETYIGADDLTPFGFSETQPLDVYYSNDNGEIWHKVGPAGTTLMVDSLGAYMLGIPISNDTEAPQISAILNEETGLMHINVSDNIGVRTGTLQVLVNGELREVSVINESNFELQLSEEEMQHMVVVVITVSDLAENEGRLFVVFNIDKPDNTEIQEVRDGKNAEIHLTRRALTVDGASPGAIVTVYSVNGIVQEKAKTDADGHAEINLNSLLEGVYIVTLSDGKSKKFYVK